MKKYLIIFLIISSCTKENSYKLPIYGRKIISEKIINGKKIIDTLDHTISNFSFINQDGKTVNNLTFNNSIYVADFFFTSCPAICPLMKNEMMRVYRKYINEEKIKLLSHTINPEFDTVERLKEFAKNSSLSFSDIDMGFINNFKSFSTSYLEQKPRTITNQLIFIRTMYNLAINEGIIDRKYYPFAGENEKIRIKSGNKIGLTKPEIERIEKLKLEKGSSIWHTRNVWLFSYYFAGVRISDVLEMKWSDFVDGRLYYQMNKNEKPVSLKVPNNASQVLSLYSKGKKSQMDYVFPFLKKADPKSKVDLFTKTRNATKLLNKYLKRIADMCDIDKNLSNHIARHSFGNIAGDNIYPLMLQKLYRHTDLKTTINYQANFIHKEADEALEKVLNS